MNGRNTVEFMRDPDDVVADLAAEVFEPDNGYVVTPDGRMRDCDVARLLRMSERQARELREEGRAWRRYSVPLNGSRYSVFLIDLGEWIASREES